LKVALIGSVRGGKRRYRGKRGGGDSSPEHIGTPANCYRLMIDMFDRTVAKYIEGESDEKV
jgi:hypothetical protein